jgi:hypothetical protein
MVAKQMETMMSDEEWPELEGVDTTKTNTWHNYAASVQQHKKW